MPHQPAQARLVFDKTLGLIKELDILRRSSQLFIVYAHNKRDNVTKASDAVAKQLITWLDYLKMPIYTDKIALVNRCFFDHTLSNIGSSQDMLKFRAVNVRV